MRSRARRHAAPAPPPLPPEVPKDRAALRWARPARVSGGRLVPSSNRPYVADLGFPSIEAFVAGLSGRLNMPAVISLMHRAGPGGGWVLSLVDPSRNHFWPHFWEIAALRVEDHRVTAIRRFLPHVPPEVVNIVLDLVAGPDRLRETSERSITSLDDLDDMAPFSEAD